MHLINKKEKSEEVKLIKLRIKSTESFFVYVSRCLADNNCFLYPYLPQSRESQSRAVSGFKNADAVRRTHLELKLILIQIRKCILLASSPTLEFEIARKSYLLSDRKRIPIKIFTNSYIKWIFPGHYRSNCNSADHQCYYYCSQHFSSMLGYNYVK